MNNFIEVDETKKEEFNKIVNHPLQSFEWGEFRQRTGIKVIRRALVENNKIVDGFTLTIHKVPKTNFNIGYLPKGNQPSKEILTELVRIGKQENCIFIQLEPNIKLNQEAGIKNQGDFQSIIHDSRFMIRTAAHPLFTKYTFILDLTPSVEELLAKMHSKTRYNIRVAEKHNVKVTEDNSEKSFEEYLRLMNETTNRQGFYAHTPKYHKLLFETLPKKAAPNSLSYHLLTANYAPTPNGQPLTLTSWVLFE